LYDFPSVFTGSAGDTNNYFIVFFFNLPLWLFPEFSVVFKSTHLPY